MHTYFILVIKKDLTTSRMWCTNHTVTALLANHKDITIFRSETTQTAHLDGDVLIWIDVKEVEDL